MTDSPDPQAPSQRAIAPSPPSVPPDRQRKVPLRVILVVPYVLQLAVVVGLVGWFSFRQGQQAVDQVSAKLRDELTRHISDHLAEILAEPSQVNRVNLAITELGVLNLKDTDRLGRLFHRQLQIFPHIGYVNYASEQKDFIGAERQNDGKIVMLQSKQGDPTHFLNYQWDDAGRKRGLYETYDPLSIKEEGWYADAAKAGKPIWSSIYQWQHRPEVLSISASIPLYDSSRTLKGVLGVDLILSQIGEFLHDLKMPPHAKAIVLERNGLLIANSAKEPPYLKVKGTITRKPATASQDPLIRASAQFLQRQFGSLSAIQSPQQLSFRLGQETQYVQLFPWKDKTGLDWLVMIVIPESDLMGKIHHSARYTLFLALGALTIAVGLGLFTSHRIVRTVRQLGWASEAIADGQLDHTIAPSRIQEMSTLGLIFTRMAAQLRNAFETLETRVLERTVSLQQAEEKYRSIFENASDGIYQTTPDGKYHSANPALAKLYGYPSPRALMTQIQNIPAQLYVDPARRHQFIHEIQTHGQVNAFESQIYRQDGSVIWISENARAVHNAQGELLYYEGIVIDITRRKLAEDALRASEQKLRRQNKTLIQLTKNRAISEGRLQEALQDIATTAAELFAIDRVSIWFYASEPNRLDCALLYDGGQRPQVPTRALLEQDCPEFFKALYTESWIAASDVGVDPRLVEITPTYLEPQQIKAFLSVPLSVSNQFLGMLCLAQREVYRDWALEEEGFARSLADLIVLAVEARDRKQSERALAQAKELAESANRSKSQFLSTMSHELRTPLNAVIGFTQILQRDASLGPEQQEYIGIINRSGEHLLGLINDVLEMSKIEAGRVSLAENNFDLSRLLATVESMFRIKAQDKGLQLNIECANQVPCYFCGDEGKLRQVLINLLGNAIKFTETGHVTLRLTSQSTQTPEASAVLLGVAVEDTGPGIAPEEMDLLFQSFRQTEAGRKSQQGTGLGLSISHHFVALMGGQLQVQSTLGHGTRFSFQIPLTQLDSVDNTVEVQSPRILGLAPHQPPCRILVVDDQLENRLVLVKLLTPLGFEVAEAQDGQEAIDVNQTWQPHLILMDMRMPRMDGYEATRRIKAGQTSGQPKIIALTASALEEERSLILHTGCDDFVAKPFRAEMLLSKIAAYTDVAFVYEPTAVTTVRETKPEASATDLTAGVAEIVAQMPLDWQKAVYQAACRGDDDALLELGAQLPTGEGSGTFTQWVSNFQFELIIELTQSQRLEVE